MSKDVSVKTERVDDIPLLFAELKRMGVQELLDKYFPAHGNRQGLSMGEVTVVWLSHILSQADHRMNHVQNWVENHIESIRKCLGKALVGLDLSDDRLGKVLKELSDDSKWKRFEEELSQSQIQVYDLKTERVRLDSTTASGYWEENKEGLLQRGHSKDHRPDLSQVKIMLATLDPLGLPITSAILSGNRSDDGLYTPAVEQVRETIGKRGLLYVGDCKMGSLSTRQFIQSGGDYYLCPLAKNQVSSEEMQQYLLAVKEEKVKLEEVCYEYANGKSEVIAKGYEQVHTCYFQQEDTEYTWEERRLVVYSFSHAKSGKCALQARIDKTKKELESINQPCRGKKPCSDIESFTKLATNIIIHNRVQSLFVLDFYEQIEQRTQRAYRDRPARVLEKRRFRVDYTLDSDAVDTQMQVLGWRAYATNHPLADFSLPQAVAVYRQEYLIEHGFGRFKGQPLSLTPMFLQREDHIKGLIRLLSIGLRLLTLVEFQLRHALFLEQSSLAGLYAGNPKRSTTQPTTERILAAFKEITLVLIDYGTELYAHLTSLSPLQQKILQLLNFPIEIYTRLLLQSDHPP
ncbi:MAG: IS1634 family transposase [Pseudanabaena sp. Salubria-1]|jgi:transposase|nr:IS1634 family transposase [Pseudanabaena sp. Salubria-1]